MSARRFRSLAVILSLLCVPAAALSQTEAAEEKPSLYERLGGLAPISVVVNDFIDAMVPDEVMNKNPAIDATRKTVPASYLKYHVTAMVCQAAGGPCQYSGRGMAESHAHLNITGAEWDRMVVILTGVLNKHGVPAEEQAELMEIMGSTKGEIVTKGL
jgi:hemoglobin